MNNYIIYALKEKMSNEIRYVGLTTQKLKRRFYDHLRCKKRDYKYNWIKKVGKDNIEAIILEDKIQTKEILIEREIFYIKYYKDNGHRLTNLTNGGEGWNNTPFSDEHKKNISLTHADVTGEKNPMFGKKHTDDAKKIMSDKRKGLKVTDKDILQKYSDLNKGTNNNNCTLNESKVIMIREYYISGKYNMTELADMFNVKRAAISKIITRRTWKHI